MGSKNIDIKEVRVISSLSNQQHKVTLGGGVAKYDTPELVM